MFKWTLTLSIFLSMPLTAHAEAAYAEKCSELIEQAKSPTANWTTSLDEAAMAGECIGVIKAVSSQIHNLRKSSYRRYRCDQGSVLELASQVVSHGAQTMNDVVDALCEAR